MSTIKFRITKELILSEQDDKDIMKEFKLNQYNRESIITIDTENKTISISSDFICKYLTLENLIKLINSVDFRKDHQEMIKEYKEIISQLREVGYEFDLFLRRELDRILKRSLLGKTVDESFYNSKNDEWISSTELPNYGGVVSVSKAKKINEDFVSTIEALIDDREEPFLASHFLDLASSTKDPKIKWVVGTIALEVAIKETIIRLDKRLEVLFNEIPSPPLRKLYKHVLKSLTGHVSPFYKEVHDGSEIRNKIVHKPSKMEIENQDAVDYLSMVNLAIDHLVYLTRCIKNDEKPEKKYYLYININFKKYK